MQIPQIKTANGSWANNNSDKAKIFAEYLEVIFQPNENSSGLNIKENFTNEVCQGIQNIKLTTTREVMKEIKLNIKQKKSPGYLISREILHNLPKKAIIKITMLINAAFKLQYVPSLWKIAEVIMIPKPGKLPHDVTSYRLISLLPVLSKLFEKILIKRLNLIIERKGLIPSHQLVFVIGITDIWII